jgi:hypothetical protein
VLLLCMPLRVSDGSICTRSELNIQKGRGCHEGTRIESFSTDGCILYSGMFFIILY